MSEIAVEQLDGATLYNLQTEDGPLKILFAENTNPDTEHDVTVGDDIITWKGAVHVLR